MPESRAVELTQTAWSAPIAIERCGRTLPCQQSWLDLESLKDETDVRFCVLCQRAVFLCRSAAELDRNAALGRCAAVVPTEAIDLPGGPAPDQAAA